MSSRPPEALLQDARLGPGKVFVLATRSEAAVETQAKALFEAVDGVAKRRDGWLVDDRFAAAEPGGFADRMRKREAGEITWEKECPHEFAAGDTFPTRPVSRIKQPYTMMTFGGYPCWVIGRHLYSIDLFNAGNELLLPLGEPLLRMWALWCFPLRVLLPDAGFGDLIRSAATALQSDRGFGGQWLAQAVYAYRFAEWSDNQYLQSPSPGLHLADMAFAHMLFSHSSLPEDVRRYLCSDAFQVRRVGSPGLVRACEEHEHFLMIHAGPMFPDADDGVAGRIAEALRLPYAKSVIVREG